MEKAVAEVFPLFQNKKKRNKIPKYMSKLMKGKTTALKILL